MEVDNFQMHNSKDKDLGEFIPSPRTPYRRRLTDGSFPAAFAIHTIVGR
jgi:hypothetical protein